MLLQWNKQSKKMCFQSNLINYNVTKLIYIIKLYIYWVRFCPILLDMFFIKFSITNYINTFKYLFLKHKDKYL